MRKVLSSIMMALFFAGFMQTAQPTQEVSKYINPKKAYLWCEIGTGVIGALLAYVYISKKQTEFEKEVATIKKVKLPKEALIEICKERGMIHQKYFPTWLKTFLVMETDWISRAKIKKALLTAQAGEDAHHKEKRSVAIENEIKELISDDVIDAMINEADLDGCEIATDIEIPGDIFPDIIISDEDIDAIINQEEEPQEQKPPKPFIVRN